MTEPVADEALLLDLLNSTPIVDGGQEDFLEPRGAPEWLRAHGGSGTPAERRHVLAARELLQALVRGESEAASLQPLLDGVRSVPAIDGDGVTWNIDVVPSRSLAVRAVLAWDELRRLSPGRLRPCANHDCARFLVDHSKPNRARWCSMAVCGNRMKARRHYERTRSST